METATTELAAVPGSAVRATRFVAPRLAHGGDEWPPPYSVLRMELLTRLFGPVRVAHESAVAGDQLESGTIEPGTIDVGSPAGRREAAPSGPPRPGPPPTAPRLAHVGALDGIRGLAVLAVMAFHAGLSWAGGGFLGVDALLLQPLPRLVVAVGGDDLVSCR